MGLFALAGVSVAEALLLSASARGLEVVTAVAWALHYCLAGASSPFVR